MRSSFNRYRRGFLCILLGVALLIPWMPARADDTLNELIRKTRQELSKKKQKEHSVLNSLINSQQNLEVSKKKLDYINKQMDNTHSKIQSTAMTLNKLKQNLNQMENRQENRRGLLTERMVAVYKYGIASYLQVFFQAQGFADFVSRFETAQYFFRHDVILINAMEDQQQQISLRQEAVARQKSMLEQEQQNYSSLQAKVGQENQKYSTYVAQSQQELESIQADRKRLEAALDEYERTSKEIEQQIRKTERTGGIRLGTGNMIWPVKGPIASGFGYRYHPILHKQKFHNGLDIAVPSGTPVLAADSGVVLVAGWRGGYGNYVAIDHGNGISSGYGHNSSLLVHEGEAVVRGQVIARSGSTGLSTGPHVHFEIRVNGDPVNPLSYLH